MKNNASLVFSFFLLIGDFLALIAAFAAAYIVRVKIDDRPLIEQIPAEQYLYAFLAILPLWILVHAVIGLYTQSVYEKRFAELGRLLIGSFLGILVIIGYDFVTDETIFPARLVPVYALAIGFGFLVLFRTIARWIRRYLYGKGYSVSNVIIIGDTNVSKQIADSLQDVRVGGQQVIATIGCEIKPFNRYDDFETAIARIRRPIHSIIQTELYSNQAKNNQILKYAQENHVSYRFVPGNTDLFIGNLTVELFENMPLISVHQTALIGWGRIVKRLFDVAFAALSMVIVIPIVAIFALLIKITDPGGGIFFKQTRLTRFDRQFTLLKLRTHKQRYNGLSPEEAFKLMGKPELAKKYRQNGDSLENDPRISRLGRFMRKASIDELPQLFNVIKGDLSLVGPRALIPEELAMAEKRHTILSVKSGITGLAQISGRRDIGFDERRRLDAYYVQNWSFWLDTTILLKTLRAVLTGYGAK